MVRTICLNEDRHAVTMLHGLHQLKHEDDFCDFTIKVKSLQYRVHRNIIAVASPYFKAMLRHDTKERQEAEVEMHNVDSECVKSCIEFMYSGKFDIPDGKISELLHVVIMMQLEDVKEAICNILDEELKAENFYQARSIARMYNLPVLVQKCNAYYEENFRAISALADFQNEKKSDVVDMLKSKKLKMNEDDKLAVSLKWVGNNPEKCKELFDFVKYIKLQKVSHSFLSDLLRCHPVISNDLHLYKMINQPLIGFTEKTIHDKNELCDKLLIFFNQESDCLQSYNLATEEVTKFHDEKFKHFGEFNAISAESYIYVLCGNKSVHRLNFKDKSSKWERMQDMIVAHGYHPPVVSFSGSLYVITTSGDPTKDVEKFDPGKEKWLRLEEKPAAVRWPTLVTLDDSIYCIGGYDGFKYLNTHCKYIPSVSKWIDLEPMKIARWLCGAVAIQQRVVVMGGWYGSFQSNDVECYDVASGQWTYLSSMIEAHSYVVAHHVGSWIFSVSRHASSNDVEKYDIQNDKWSKVEFNNVSNFGVYDCSLVNV